MSVFEKVGDVQFVKKNDSGYYSFKLDDDKWYGHSNVTPEFEKGDRIKFQGSTNKRGDVTYYNADPDTVKVKKGAGTVKPYKKSGGGGTGAKSAESKAYWDKRIQMDVDRVAFDHEKHEVIGEYSIRNSAIAYLDLLREVGGLPIGKLKTAAAIHKAMDACLDAIIEQFRGEALVAEIAVTKDVSNNVVNFKDLEKAEDFDDVPAASPETTGDSNDGKEEW